MEGSSGSDLEEIDEFESVSGTESSVGILEELLERYTFTVRPELCLKLRKRTQRLQLGLNLSRWRDSNHCSLVLKPEKPEAWLRKVTLSSYQHRLELSTKKFHFGNDLLTFSAVAGLDLEQRKPSLNWKFSTRWSLGTFKIGRKEKFPLGPAAEFRPRWKLDFSAPQVEGAMGGDGDQAVQVDQGHAHLSIPRMEIKLQLDDALQWRRSRGSSASGQSLQLTTDKQELKELLDQPAGPQYA
ncbi:hypothetical protein WJX84_009304 [Apatococcus fuscideae]|uniref:DUF7781 domain-containing protein n=1 Tax=Apatococcus fuscideae TaxID=2026836 RepID=A0AAW1TGS1_9CHLO